MCTREHTRAHAHAPWHVCGGWRAALRSWVSHLPCVSLMQVARLHRKQLYQLSPSPLVLLNSLRSPVCVLKAAVITCAYELITDVLNLFSQKVYHSL